MNPNYNNQIPGSELIMYQLCKEWIAAVFKSLQDILCAVTAQIMAFDLLVVLRGINAVAGIRF